MLTGYFNDYRSVFKNTYSCIVAYSTLTDVHNRLLLYLKYCVYFLSIAFTKLFSCSAHLAI